MKENMLSLIKDSFSNKKSYEDLVHIYELYEQLQFDTNITQMAENIFSWLNKKYNIDNLILSLFDINKNEKEDIFKKGEEFYLDDELAFFFIINTHTNLNATLSFSATSKVHYKILQENYKTIQSSIFQITPIIQSAILKKNYIESSSLDSVTNVFTRNYLINNLNTHLRLTQKKQNEIFFLMIGIDHFKAVIDEFNYDIGDKILIELAKVIHSNINEFDMVARLNGDEFLVTILNPTNDIEVENIAEKIINNFSQTKIKVNKEQVLQKTICIGIEKYFQNGTTTISQAIKNSDIALYEAKNKKRSSFFKYTDLKSEDTIELF